MERSEETKRPSRFRSGFNIGRSKIVQTKDAAVGYVYTFDKLYPYGDFFTINVSSPNPPQLRDLQERDLLRELLQAIQEKNHELVSRLGQTPKPVLVKIAPDMEFSQADDIVGMAMSENIVGIIATNATAFCVRLWFPAARSQED